MDFIEVTLCVICRLLIAEAEKAAEALEIAATKSPIAQASLIETRKLIAQAVQSLESIEAEHPILDENHREPLAAPDELSTQVYPEIYTVNGSTSRAKGTKINGTKTLATVKEEEFDFSKFSLQDVLNDEEELLPWSYSGNGLSSFSLENLLKQYDSRDKGEDEPEQVQTNAESARENEPQQSTAKVDIPKEEMPSKSIAVTKKWVCGRLVTDGAQYYID